MNNEDMTRFIPRGYQNGVSREELRRRTGLSDRKIREYIEWTSENVETIYSYNGRYFLYGGSTDRWYCKLYYQREKSRAHTQIRKVRRMGRMWEENDIPGQIDMEW